MTWEGYYWTACGYAMGMWMALHIDWPAHLPWWGCALVYVGQSVNILSRLTEHLGKDFDAAYVMPMPDHMLDTVELALIEHLKPPLNKSTRGLVSLRDGPEIIAELYGVHTE